MNFDYLRSLKSAAMILALCVIASGSFFVGMDKGLSKGRRRGAAAGHEAAFVASFSALQRLRAGEACAAITNLEAFCYSSAVALLQQPSERSNVIGSWFYEDLLRYREKYAASNSYPTDAILRSLLSNRRTGAIESPIPP